MIKPPNAPNITDNIAQTIIIILLIKYDINIKGAIFCQVIKMKQFIQDNPSIILGNQKWKGAAPVFNNSLDKIIKFIEFISLLIK